MQIFEITAKNKAAVNEDGLLGSLAAGIGQGLAQNFQQAALGGTVQQKTPATGERQLAAMNINQASIQPLAQSMQKSWSQMVQTFLKDVRPPVPTLGQVNPNDLNTRLRPQMDRLVQDLIQRGFDINTLDKEVAGDPAMEQAAKIIKQNYASQMNALWKETVAPTNKNILPEVFLSLARDVVAPAQSMLSFNATNQSQQKTAPSAAKPMSPAAQQMAAKLGLDNQDIAALQNFAKSNPQAFAQLAGTTK
jgi:hypothetical protein